MRSRWVLISLALVAALALSSYLPNNGSLAGQLERATPPPKEPAYSIGETLDETGATTAPERLLGVIYDGPRRSKLVTFDARTGAIVRRLLQLDPHDSVSGIAHARSRHRLYVLGERSYDLYSIDTRTLKIKHYGNLRIDRSPQAGVHIHVDSLAYDSRSDTLYTTLYPHASEAYPTWTELAIIDPSSAQVSVIGRIDGAQLGGLLFNEEDHYLYGLARYGDGPTDTYKVIRIDPKTASSEVVYSTRYRLMIGFILKPPSRFISWINDDDEGHFYTEGSLTSPDFVRLADTEGSIDLVFRAVYEDFTIRDIAPPPTPMPVSFAYEGIVEAVSDPDDVLGGSTVPGQRFTGELRYDASSPWHKGEPNGHPPYGLSFHLGGIDHEIEGLEAYVVNNFYDDFGHTLKDAFGLYANNVNSVRAFWTLEDSTAHALSRNDLLPTQFRLSRWSTNRFIVKPLDPATGLTLYTIWGRVDRIQRTGD